MSDYTIVRQVSAGGHGVRRWGDRIVKLGTEMVAPVGPSPLLPSRGPNGGTPMSHTSRGRRRLVGPALLALVTAGLIAVLSQAQAPRVLADDAPSPAPAPTPAPGIDCR